MEHCEDAESEKKQRHQQLAGVVKGVHAKLRKELKQSTGDYETIWADHCQNMGLLEDYAEAMKHLATEIWPNNPESRIYWCRQTCLSYFLHGDLKKVLEKDERRKMHEHYKYQKQDITAGVGASKNEIVTGTQIGCVNQEKVAAGPNSASVDNNEMISNGGKLLTERQGCIEQESRHDCLTVSSGLSRNIGCCKITGLDGSSHNDVHQNKGQKRLNFPRNGGKSPGLFPESEVCGSIEGSIEAQRVEVDERLCNTITLPFKGKICVLDVGSCYNPFLEFEEFLALGIDLCPAVESVYQCDFLHLDIAEPLQGASDTINSYIGGLRSPVKRLPQASFHTVVFSLLLEYFPSPFQRWICCQKAHKLLALHGLLLIITPDSSHQNRNAPMINSWRVAIESLGFRRWRYTKQEHLHCMAFRKVVHESSDESKLVDDVGPDMMYIPQDFRDQDQSVDMYSFGSPAHAEEEDILLRDNFLELPNVLDE